MDNLVLYASSPLSSVSYVCRELANPTALAIIDLIWKGCETASELATKLGLTWQAVDSHLIKLNKMGIIKIERVESDVRGRSTRHYTLSKIAVFVVPVSLGSDKTRLHDILHKESQRHMKKLLGLTLLLGLLFMAAYSYFSDTINSQSKGWDILLNQYAASKVGFFWATAALIGLVIGLSCWMAWRIPSYRKRTPE